jgi:hypothetical protein
MMKKLTVIFLVFICILLNTTGIKHTFAATNTFSQGIYKLSDLNPSKNNIYYFSNISSKEKVFFVILDENQDVVHAIRLLPKSERHVSAPILPDYRIIVLGKGQVYITPTEFK